MTAPESMAIIQPDSLSSNDFQSDGNFCSARSMPVRNPTSTSVAREKSFPRNSFVVRPSDRISSFGTDPLKYALRIIPENSQSTNSTFRAKNCMMSASRNVQDSNLAAPGATERMVARSKLQSIYVESSMPPPKHARSSTVLSNEQASNVQPTGTKRVSLSPDQSPYLYFLRNKFGSTWLRSTEGLS